MRSDDAVTGSGADEVTVGSVKEAMVAGWGTTKSIYYANSLSWRFLKSGALFFLGFFCWAGANLLLAYNPGWTFLRYVLAYGFLLTWYGPVHHLVVIPLALRWRRSGGRRHRVGRWLPLTMLLVFLAAVLVLGAAPVDEMTVDLGATFETAGGDIDPMLSCVKSETGNGTEVHCHFSRAEGVDRAVVESGGREIRVDADPPYEFTVHEDELAEVNGRTGFRVTLLDEDGDLVRRYTRRLDTIPEG